MYSKVIQFVCLFVFLVGGWGILHSLQDSDQGSNMGPQHWKLRVLKTGPPGNAPKVIHMYVYVFRFFFFMCYYSILNIVPHAMWQVLVHLFYIY